MHELQSPVVYSSLQLCAVLGPTGPPTLLSVRSSRGGAVTFRGVSEFSVFFSRPGSAHTHKHPSFRWVRRVRVCFEPTRRRIVGRSHTLCVTRMILLYLFYDYEILKVTAITIPAAFPCLETNLDRFRWRRARFEKVSNQYLETGYSLIHLV